MVTILNNVFLAIKVVASMVSVQHIRGLLAKCRIPETWRRKNYAFEFVECSRSVKKTGSRMN
jgi:hypothetical protein